MPTGETSRNVHEVARNGSGVQRKVCTGNTDLEEKRITGRMKLWTWTRRHKKTCKIK